MTFLQKSALACVLCSPVALHASDVSKSLAADNVVQCQLNTGCFSKSLLGRVYRVIQTPRFTVMVSISREGEYTRADLSILNSSGIPLSVMPDDFRIETMSSPTRIFPYIAPAGLHDVPPPPPIPPAPTAPAATSPTPDIDQLYTAAKKHQAELEAFDKAMSNQYLTASVLPPDQTVRGRIYFDQAKHPHQINLILPIAGQVFEFPFDLR